MNLNQITLPVHDIAEATEFYLKLGMIQIVKSDHYARFKCPEGDTTFSLMLTDDPITNSAVIYFEQENLDQWVDHLTSLGIQFKQLPTDMRYLWREAVLLDPSGNKIKLYWAGEARLAPPWKVNITNEDATKSFDVEEKR